MPTRRVRSCGWLLWLPAKAPLIRTRQLAFLYLSIDGPVLFNPSEVMARKKKQNRYEDLAVRTLSVNRRPLCFPEWE
jgi:hypothetical protein